MTPSGHWQEFSAFGLPDCEPRTACSRREPAHAGACRTRSADDQRPCIARFRAERELGHIFRMATHSITLSERAAKRLLKKLGCTRDEEGRDLKPQCLCGLQIYHQVELSGLLDR